MGTACPEQPSGFYKLVPGIILIGSSVIRLRVHCDVSYDDATGNGVMKLVG